MASKTTGVPVKNQQGGPGNKSRQGRVTGPHTPVKTKSIHASPDSVVNPKGNKTNAVTKMSTNPKAQPMYTGKASLAGKTAKQYGTGLVKDNGKGFDNSFPDVKRGSGRPVGGSQKGQ